MANTLANLARMYTETTGTGTLTLTTAVPGFNSFADAGVASGSTITYAIYCGPHREIGAGVYTASGLTLTRGTVYSSTNGGAKISLTGRSEVFITAAAEDLASFSTDLTAHLNDTAGAHAASAISFSATGNISSTDVQAAIAELDSEKLAVASNLSDLASASTARTNLGLGTAAVQNTGTSGANIPFLNGANTWSGQQIVDLSASSPLANGLVVQSTEDSASGGPGILVRRISTSPAANDQLGFFQFQGRDSAGNNTIYASLSADIIDTTDGSEDGGFSLNTIKAGTVSGSMSVRLGALIGSPTGGDQGVGTLNAVTLYENGTSLAAKYQPLDSELTAIAGLTSAADRLPYFTGSGTAALATFTAAGRNLVDDADASAQRTTLSALFGTVGGVTSVYAGQTAAAMNNHTVLVGQAVGNASMAANNNTLIGGGATASPGDGITSGNFNVVIGNNSGGSISSGTTNIVIGSSAGTAITTTSYNTLLGGLAGQYVTGQYNACFGYNAGTGQSGLTDGDANVAFGNFALKVVTTADNCTAVGSSALTALTTASGTTAVGVSALANITTGTGNSAVGNSAGFYLPTSASNNTLIGDFALGGASGVTTNAASNNVAIGYNAAKGAGWTSGANNTIIGSGAMSHATVTSASNNIAIGYNCANSVITTGTYNIFIGDAIAPAAATQSNEINIGGVYRGTNTANGRANPYGAILGWTNSGDVAPAAGTGVTQLPAECFTIGSQVVASVKTWYIYVNDAGTVKKLQIAVA